MYDTITLHLPKSEGCPKCGSKHWHPTDEVIKGAAGVAHCKTCGEKRIVVHRFFEIMESHLILRTQRAA